MPIKKLINHMNSKQLIKNAFNKAANLYNNHCHLQFSAGKKLISLLNLQQFNLPRIIDLGCGTGIVTRELASQRNYSDFHAIDMADQFICKAKECLSEYNLKIYESDFDHLYQANNPFDIIFSNMSLHWSPNFQATLHVITQMLSKNGILAFSIPLAGTFHELQTHCAVNDFFEQRFVENLIRLCGLELESANEKFVFQFDNLLEALKSVKAVGANYVNKNNRRLQYNASLRKQLQDSMNTSITLTYHVGYFIAKKV